MIRRPVCLLLLLSVALLFAGCNRAQQGRPTDANVDPASPLRIITLSPHLAEMIFAIGAGSKMVGVSAYTNYPEETLSLPVIGDAFSLDQERLALLKPDALIAWESGTPAHVIDDLRSRGYRVEVVKTAGIDDVPASLRRLGRLTGNVDLAEVAASTFEAEVQQLENDYIDAQAISVFYQVARRPLYTVSGAHYISEIVQLCGGQNIFVDLGPLAPTISVEAVLQRNPEVLLASEDAGASAFADWDRWPDLAANRFGNRFLMPADEIGKATPRTILAARAMCEALDTGRNNRASRLE